MGESGENDSRVPSQDDHEAILEASRDYIDGWYTGDEGRMRRSLHPDLVKRRVEPGAAPGTWVLGRTLNGEMMAEFTSKGGGKNDVPPDQRRYQIDVLDVFRNIATARCVSPQYIDLLQLAKFGPGRWLIVNVLWELRPGAPPRRK